MKVLFLLFFVTCILCVDDLYRTLQVDKRASTREIRAAWKNMALQFHPEKNAALSDEFQRRSRAFQILSDEMKRHIYDQKGEEGLKDQPAVDSHVPPYSYYETFALWDGDEEIDLMNQQKWMDAGQSQDPWLILFYSGRFTMVKELGEAWRQLSRRIHDWSRTAVIDCDQPASIWVCKLNRITSLPHIISFPSGGYNGMQRPTVFNKAHNFQNYIDFAFSSQQDFVFKLDPAHFSVNTKLDKAAQSAAWLVAACVSDNSCTSLQHRLMEVAWVTQATVTVGILNCLTHRDFCSKSFGVHVPAQDFGGETKHEDYLFSFPQGLLKFPPEQLHDFDLDDASKIAIDVIKKNTPLEEMSVEKLTGIAANAMASTDANSVKANELIKHVANTQHWKATDTEYLILFYNENSDYCQRPAPAFQPSTYGFTYKLNHCDRIHRAFTGVSKWVNSDGRDLERIGHVVPVTFNCQKDAAATVLCNKLRHEKDLAIPELVLLKDHGLNPHYYHGELDRTDTIYSFLRSALGTKIHEIKEEDFNLHITNAPEKEKWMFYIMFYTGFSDASTKAMGEWHAAGHFADMPNEVHMGKMNCEANFALCEKLGVRNYPTFLLFVDGVRHQFDYDYMNAIEFVRFAKDALNPVIHEFTPDEFRKKVWDPQAFGNSFGDNAPGSEEVEKIGWVMNFFAPWCVHCHTMAPLFESAGTVLKGVVKYGKLNCELEEGFCHSLAIMRYPTIRKYPAEPSRRSQAAEYEMYTQPSPLSILQFSLKEIANHMVPMNSDSFQNQVKGATEETSWLVYYVGPGCTKCEEVGLQMHALSSRLFGRYQAKMKGAEKHGPEFVKQYKADQGIQLYTAQVDCATESVTCVSEKISTWPSLVYYSAIRNTAIPFSHPGVTGLDPPAHEDVLEILAFVNDELEKDRTRYNSPDRVHPLIEDKDYQFEFLDKTQFQFHSEL